MTSKLIGTKQPKAGGGNLKKNTVRIFIGITGVLGMALAGSQASWAGSINFASGANGSDVYVVDNSNPDFSNPTNIPSFTGAP